MTDRELVQIALEVREKAYAPYSGFRVGAALLTDTGKVYTGVNIENISYGATNCAERTAVFKAVSEGVMKFSTIAISSDSKEFTFPCGICRQVMKEFTDKNTRIICSNNAGEYTVLTMDVRAFCSTEQVCIYLQRVFINKLRIQLVISLLHFYGIACLAGGEAVDCITVHKQLIPALRIKAPGIFASL